MSNSSDIVYGQFLPPYVPYSSSSQFSQPKSFYKSASLSGLLNRWTDTIKMTFTLNNLDSNEPTEDQIRNYWE